MYAEMDSVEAGLKFKTRAGLVVETTGVSQQIENHEVHVHEVVIVEGEGQGEKYLHNLDFAGESLEACGEPPPVAHHAIALGSASIHRRFVSVGDPRIYRYGASEEPHEKSPAPDLERGIQRFPLGKQHVPCWNVAPFGIWPGVNPSTFRAGRHLRNGAGIRLLTDPCGNGPRRRFLPAIRA